MTCYSDCLYEGEDVGNLWRHTVLQHGPPVTMALYYVGGSVTVPLPDNKHTVMRRPLMTGLFDARCSY